MSNVPREYIDGLNHELKRLEQKILDYFNSFKDQKQIKLYDYVENVDFAPKSHIESIAKISAGKSAWYEIPISLDIVTKVKITLTGLPLKYIIVSIDFPKLLFGEINLNPRIRYSTSAPIPYPGNFAVVWEGFSKVANKYSFHPFGSSQSRDQDLHQYFEEGIVDLFCNTLNNGDYAPVKSLHSYLNSLLMGDRQKYIKYQSNYLMDPLTISLPILGTYDSKLNQNTLSVTSWAYGKNWIPAQEVIMGILYPIASIMSMFDDNGDFIEGSTPVVAEKRKKDLRSISDQERIKDMLVDDPFKIKTAKIQRDEFGYEIGGGGLQRHDITSARKSIWELQKEKAENNPTQIKNDTSHVKKFSNATDWFNQNQLKRYDIKGDPSSLSFVDRGNIQLAQSCKPPFILKFARDQVKIRRQVTSTKAIEILFNVYNLGFLHEV